VIVGPHSERLTFNLRILVGGKDNDRDVLRSRIGPELTDEGQAVNDGHDQVLKYDCGPDLVGQRDGLAGVRAIMEINIGLIGQRAADGFADHGWVCHEEDHDVVIRRVRGTIRVKVEGKIGAWFRHWLKQLVSWYFFSVSGLIYSLLGPLGQR